MIARRALLVLLLICGAGFAAAAETRPAFTVETRALTGEVVIDPKLKAYPALHDRLLASGKRDLARMLRDSERDFKDSPDLFADGRQYSYTRGYRLRSVVGRYVSILRTDDTYTGGAHPNHVIDTLMWDAQAGRMMNISPFFSEMADNGPTLTLLAREIREVLAVEKRARGMEVNDPDKDGWLSAVEARITAIGGIALAPSTVPDKSAGLIAYFSPYAVGSYAEGVYTAFIPWQAFAPRLSPQGHALFGGERPKDDTDSD